MEYQEAAFLQPDEKPNNDTMILQNILENPILIFPNYSSVFKNTLMEIHEKQLIQRFQKNLKSIKKNEKLEEEKNKIIQSLSIFQLFLKKIKLLRVDETDYMAIIDAFKKDNQDIAKEYKKHMSRIIKENEKISLKKHMLHYYDSKNTLLQKSTEENCNSALEDSFLTVNIEDTQDKEYFLFLHNWIMSPIKKSFTIEETIQLHKEIVTD